MTSVFTIRQKTRTLLTTQPMLLRRQVRLAVVNALQLANTAGNNGWTIQSPGDWNTPTALLPAILVRGVSGSRAGITRAQPQFNTEVGVEIDARIMADDASTAQDAIESLEYQIEQAVLNDYWLQAAIQKWSEWNTTCEVTAEGTKHIGAVRLQLRAEAYEAWPNLPQPAASTWPPAEPGAPVPLEQVNFESPSARGGVAPTADPTDVNVTPAVPPLEATWHDPN